tara:strand:+ start:12 stop:524 length:513 start_codon:yes stop_codon:yes gene_type:complete
MSFLTLYNVNDDIVQFLINKEKVGSTIATFCNNLYSTSLFSGYSKNTKINKNINNLILIVDIILPLTFVILITLFFFLINLILKKYNIDIMIFIMNNMKRIIAMFIAFYVAYILLILFAYIINSLLARLYNSFIDNVDIKEKLQVYLIDDIKIAFKHMGTSLGNAIKNIF